MDSQNKVHQYQKSYQKAYKAHTRIWRIVSFPAIRRAAAEGAKDGWDGMGGEGMGGDGPAMLGEGNLGERGYKRTLLTDWLAAHRTLAAA